MNKLILLFIVSFCSNLLVTAQSDFYDTFGNTYQDELVFEMLTNFEENICNYYKVKKENSSIAYKKYVDDISQENIKFPALHSKLTTEKNLKLLKESHEELLNYVWIKSSQTKHKLAYLSYTEFTPEQMKAFENEDYFDDFIEKIKAQNFVYIINYEGNFSEKIIFQSKNNNIRDFIITFRENYVNTPLLIAPLLELKELDYKNKAVQIFIAFELFYTCLNSKVETTENE